MNQRIRSWDIAKAFAIFLVTIGHVVGSRGNMGFAACIFHVPAFYMLSGLSYQPETKGFWHFMKKKGRRILIPYFLFGVVSILIYAKLGSLAASALDMASDTREYSVTQNLWGLVYGNCKNGLMKWNLPLWFLPCLFVMNVFQYFADSFFRRLSPSGKHRTLYMAVLLILSIIIIQLNGQIFHITHLPFNIETAVTLYSFFLLGVIIRKPSIYWHNRFSQKKNFRFINLLLTVVLFAVSMYLGFNNRRIIYTMDYYGDPAVFYIAATCGAMALYFLSETIHHCRTLEYIGQRTMSILCLHKFPILLFQVLLPVSVASDFPSLIVAIISIGLCLIADIMIQKWFPFFLGNSYRK